MVLCIERSAVDATASCTACRPSEGTAKGQDVYLRGLTTCVVTMAEAAGDDIKGSINVEDAGFKGVKNVHPSLKASIGVTDKNASEWLGVTCAVCYLSLSRVHCMHVQCLHALCDILLHVLA